MLNTELLANTDSNRSMFQQLAVNSRFYYSEALGELNRLESLGISVQVDGMTKEELCAHLRDLQRKTLLSEYQNSCRTLLDNLDISWHYPAPRLFLVLPTDLDSWDALDPATHSFRLFFMCDHWKHDDDLEVIPQHVHLSNHSGYNIKRPQKFFQIYGDYALRVLQMVERGYSNDHYMISPLDTFKILWSHDPVVTGSQISKDTIGSLVDKAIAYLQQLSPPKLIKEPTLTRKQAAEIKTYLDVQEGANTRGCLHRVFRFDSSAVLTTLGAYWMCPVHSQELLNHEVLEALMDFVEDRKGNVNMQQATVKVELSSATEADQFSQLLQDARHIFNVTVKLCWKATRSSVEKLCQGVASANARALELDGVGLDIYPQDRVMCMKDLFGDVVLQSTGLMSIALFNYPRPQAQCLHLRRVSLQLQSPLPQSEFNWMRLDQVGEKFWFSYSRAKRVSDLHAVASELTLALEENGIETTTAMVTIGSYEWNNVFVFDLKTLTFVEYFCKDMKSDRNAHFSGTARKLTVHFNDPQFDKGLSDAVQANNTLEKLNVSFYGHNMLYYTENIVRLWLNSSTTSQLTLIDRMRDTQGRVVARLARQCDSRILEAITAITPHDTEAYPKDHELQLDLSKYVEFLHWDCDHVFSPLSDYSASFLEMAMEQHPSVLTLFTLDTSQVSRQGLLSIQNILRRSRLEQLIIVCTPIDPSISESVAKALGSVQWPTLKSLTFLNAHIDAWIRLWMSPHSSPFTPNATGGDLRLLNLHLQGAGSVPQSLSHTSALFVHGLIYASPWIKVHLENITLDEYFFE
ncbi:hypothetical protein MVEG_01235 [Podila verticillata NRRL 6337]|nr:hypothetical protein MVEG_01235 [Podila verticillata NRRL 6337]